MVAGSMECATTGGEGFSPLRRKGWIRLFTVDFAPGSQAATPSIVEAGCENHP
jgi:hypothetical protein